MSSFLDGPLCKSLLCKISPIISRIEMGRLVFQDLIFLGMYPAPFLTKSEKCSKTPLIILHVASGILFSCVVLLETIRFRDYGGKIGE